MKKLNIPTKIITFLLLLTLSLSQASGTVQAASTRPSDTSKAGSGNILAGVTGTFERVEKAKILKRINEIRKEACEKGYPNPSNGRKLTPSDYRPMKWSSNLELVALLRAAESTVNESHTRPNGQSCFSIRYNGEQSWAENLAWNYSGLMAGIEQWYEEKNDWVNQNANAVTGHYTSLINPAYQFIGLGSFRRSTGGWYGVSAEFSSSNAGSQTQSKLKGKKVQTIEVSKKNLSNPSLNAPSKLKVKKTKQLTVSCNINYPGIMGGTNTTKGRILKGVTWKSSKPSVLHVNSSGKITAKKAGKATITAKVKGGFSVKKTITVTK
ncbi:hypothetical protein E5329_02965 [Petralouisia muris]|jgi:uncharacterized protein YkwD|uniref:Uncharacterized protein n=1 Tax=Petralouisia muris TaxID=3032872 RepID=A0AC61S070_9FIRM|nr:CAP domain-containing protein [Petralouisia muris]TGY97827.1 hypothetical protein E5329_02965 [Petralouisia muris]